mgnify:FL=1
MIDDRFQQKGLGKKVLEYVLQGLKIQGVKEVIFMIDDADHIAKKRCLSFGFRFTGKIDHDECYYALELEF